MLENDESRAAIDEVYSYATLPSSPALSCRNNISNFKARVLGFYRRQMSSSSEEKASSSDAYFQHEHRTLLHQESTENGSTEHAKKWCQQNGSPRSISSGYSSSNNMQTNDHLAVKEEDIDRLLHGYTPSPQSLRRLAQVHADRKMTAASQKSCLKNSVVQNHQVNTARKNVSIQEVNRHTAASGASGIKQSPRRNAGVRKITSALINEKCGPASCNNSDIYEMIQDVVERKENGLSHRLSSCSSESPSPSLKTTHKKGQRQDSWDSGSASSVSIEMQPYVQQTPRVLDLNVAQKDNTAASNPHLQQHHYNIYNATRSVTFRPTVNSKM